MNRSIIARALPAIFVTLCFAGYSASVTEVGAQSVKQQTFDHNGSQIKVKILAPAEVVEVKPFIKTKKGKEEGRLHLDVVIKNTANEPQSYAIFGQGKTDNGGWLGGMSKVPKKGTLEPGKETKTQIRTRYEGKEIPKEIRLEVFPPK